MQELKLKGVEAAQQVGLHVVDMLEASGAAKPLMEEFARRIRAKLTGAPAQPVNGQPAPAQPTKQPGNTKAELLNFWRNT